MKFYWKKKIEEIDSKTWENVFDNNILRSYKLQKTVESSYLDNIEIEYLHAIENENTLAIIPCFTFTLELDLLTSNKLKKAVTFIRKAFKNFLKMRIFFIGTPIATCDHMLGIRETNNYEYTEIFEKCLKEIKAHIKVDKHSLMIVKEIPSHERKLLNTFKKKNIIVAKSLPNTYLLLDERLGKWTSAFRTRYRRRVRRQVKKSDSNSDFSWDVIDNFKEFSSDFEKLYLQVLSRSKYQFETLNTLFFKHIGTHMFENTKALICKDEENNIVCFELLIHLDNVLIPIYVGLDYDQRDAGDLYFSCIHKVIQYAEEHNYSKIKFGQTSYLAKTYAGCVYEELFLGIYAPNPLLQLFLRLFNGLIFTVPKLPDVKVYRSEMKEILMDICNLENIIPFEGQKNLKYEA